MISATPQLPVLDVAPSAGLSEALRQASRGLYISLDAAPEADTREVDIKASLTALPLADASIGFILCSHVLEHIPDDLSAMTEIARVLHPDGACLIQVPRRRGTATDEDLSLTRPERLQRYGQADHVRRYGDDFESRLTKAGLRVGSTWYTRVLPRGLLTVIGVPADGELWVVTSGRDPLETYDPEAATHLLGLSMVAATQAMPSPSESISILRRSVRFLWKR
ncbi:MAG: methyltransferase domain-containing protein [Actinobacteria bacterium]|nr:methyltransferase domain-containing protein [Actinomycetota bacterium]